jgi:hypothetical protein
VSGFPLQLTVTEVTMLGGTDRCQAIGIGDIDLTVEFGNSIDKLKCTACHIMLINGHALSKQG